VQVSSTKKKVAAIAAATGLVMGGVLLVAMPSYATTLALDTVVTTKQVTAGPAIDSPALSTRIGGELLLAFIATDGPEADTQAFAAVTGGGLSWRPVVRANEQAGAAEIWAAWASSALTGVHVTAVRATGSWHGQLTVAAFIGADRAAPVGTAVRASAATGAPTLTATTTRAGSWMWGVGNDWDHAVPRSLVRYQRMVDQSVDTLVDDTYWAQRTKGALSSPGTRVRFGAWSPTDDRWNLAAVEIVPAGAAGTPAASPSTAAPAPASPSTPPSPAPSSPGTPSPTQTVAGSAPASTDEFTPAYYARWSNGLPSDPNFFPIAVWDQDPTRIRNGANNATNYKNLGINTFAGLWDFPADSTSSTKLSAIESAGMYALAGDSGISIARAFPAAGALAGYQLGDEQDMSTNPSHITPDQVTSAATSIHAADPSRPIYNNWGKAFSLYPWVGAHDDTNGLRTYCSQVDISSSDYYAATDGYEPANAHTPDFYGKAVDHVRTLCGANKPAWGFVETGHPFNTNPGSWAPYSSNGTIAAATIEAGVWSELAHGANGIVYFVHDFYSNGFTEDGLFDHADAVAVVRKVDAAIAAIAPILNAQRQPAGLTVSNADATLRADAAGRYVIAAGNSASTRTATFILAAAAGKAVAVVGENRTIQADANGTWSDSFAGWGHHVYEIV
jgi:hypothetical protein